MRDDDVAPDESMTLTRSRGKPQQGRFDDGENEMSAVLSQGRIRDDMAVVRKKIGSGTDVAEVYSPSGDGS